MKVIQTRYNGYRFRSRLEARWAVLLDTLGLQWEYEPQGFVLGADAYLPDFWLPVMQVWLEVKPRNPNEREVRVARALADESQRPVAIVNGDWNDWKHPPRYLAIGWYVRPSCAARPKRPAVSEDFDASLFHCEDCGTVAFASLADEDWVCYGCGECWVPLSSVLIDKAIGAAKSARFEHGEHGGPA